MLLTRSQKKISRRICAIFNTPTWTVKNLTTRREIAWNFKFCIFSIIYVCWCDIQMVLCEISTSLPCLAYNSIQLLRFFSIPKFTCVSSFRSEYQKFVLHYSFKRTHKISKNIWVQHHCDHEQVPKWNENDKKEGKILLGGKDESKPQS